jgi:hypothetical protein
MFILTRAKIYSICKLALCLIVALSINSFASTETIGSEDDRCIANNTLPTIKLFDLLALSVRMTTKLKGRKGENLPFRATKLERKDDQVTFSNPTINKKKIGHDDPLCLEKEKNVSFFKRAKCLKRAKSDYYDKLCHQLGLGKSLGHQIHKEKIRYIYKQENNLWGKLGPLNSAFTPPTKYAVVKSLTCKVRIK